MIPVKVNQQEILSIAPYHSHLVDRCERLFDIWQIAMLQLYMFEQNLLCRS